MSNDINNINKINANLLNKINSKQKIIDMDFFHNKLLNNIIEMNNFENDFISLSNNNRKNEKNKLKNFHSPLKRINSAITSKKIPGNNENINSIIKSNKIFNKNKLNNIHNKIQNKTINEENKLLKSTIYNFPDNINAIKKKNSRVFQNFNKSQIKEDEKCNKMSKYVNILEKKMKEKLMKITNFEDLDCCYQKIKIRNFKKNNENAKNCHLFLDINKKYKLNKPSYVEDKNEKKKVLTSKSNNLNYNTKNNSTINTITYFDKYNMINLGKMSQYIKEEVKKYFIKNNFSSIKDFFNDWLNKNDNKNKFYLDIESISFYLKQKIGLKISKEDINKIFESNHNNLDIEGFKNYFFEEKSGKEFFTITKDLFLKKTKIEFDTNNNKDNYILYSRKSFNSKNKEKEFIYKYSLLFSLLKEQKSIILDKICEYLEANNNNIEYEYNDFYNLINSLKIDKNILEPKIIKALFIKYQNKNKKLNIKYFINILYGNDEIKKECLLDEKNININKNNKSKDIIINTNQNNRENNTITKESRNNNNYNINKKVSNINKKKSKSNINKKNLNINLFKNEIKQIHNNNPININKNTEYSSDNIDIVIKPKNKFFKNEINKDNIIPLCLNLKNMINKNEECLSSLNKLIKNNVTKFKNKRKKNIFSFQKDNNTNTNSIISNKEILNYNKKEKNFVKGIRKYNSKSKKEKIFHYNNFKTIKIRKKYKLNKENENSKNENNSIEKIKKRKRPLSSNIRRKKRINNKIFKKNNSNFLDFDIPEKFEESRIQYLNSDIIDLI